MAEALNKNELYNSTQNNFKKLLESAFSGEIQSGQPLDDPHILQRIQEMTNTINEPLDSCYIVPQLFRDCSEGNYEEVKNHIINCCDINEIGPDGETALACAINANNFQIVELLLKSGGNPNSKPDKIESTPLMDAANVGYTDIVRILLQSGANPDTKSSTNNTALHYAACSGHLDCCKLILDYSSNPQALIEEQNENGHTALMEAATSGFFDSTKFLVQNGAQINTPSVEFKETALTLASYKGYSDIVQYLLEAGADHEHRTDEMHTALMEASMEGHIDAAKVLLYYGAHVNMRTDSFESPLTLAACSGHSDLAAYLISYGADIEEVNDESYTPLMEAAREGHLETVAMLLSLGANINRVTEETQETAMTLAACGGFYDVVLLLHRCGADIELGASTPLMESSQEGHLDIVKALLAMGSNVDAKNSSDETSLHFAAENGHIEVCRYLLDNNADIHYQSEGGRTCLMKAARSGNIDVVLLLINRGARIDQLTTSGDHNALSLACANGHCKVVEYLLQVGADPAVKLKDNCTVLIEASRAGHIDVIEILLRDNKRDKQRLLITSNSSSLDHRHHQQSQQHMIYTMGNIDNNMATVQQLNNHYLSTTMTNTTAKLNNGQQSCIDQHVYDMNKFVNIPIAMRMQQNQQQSPLTNIYCDHHIHMTNTVSQLHSRAFTATNTNSSSLHMLTNGATVCTNLSSHDSNLTFTRPLILPTEIPDPPQNPPPLPPLVSLTSHTTTNDTIDDVALPLASIFGPDNDKLLQNMLDHNSPNIEEWVKCICPNFNNNLYVNKNHCYDHLSSSSPIKLSQSDLTCLKVPKQSSLTNGHPIRKIKKAKHSENYNNQFENCFYNCEHRLPNNFFTDKAVTVSESSDLATNCKFHRCPAEGADDCGGDMKNVSLMNQQQQQNTSSILDNNDSDSDTNLQCKDCNKYQLTNTSRDNLNNYFTYQTQSKNLFSTTMPSTILNQQAEPGVFSIDKNTLLHNVQCHDDYQSDIKRIFNSVTPTSTSPLKPMTSSTPFQKQVLQPKRRLQQSQRSPVSASLSSTSPSSLSASSLSASSSLSPENKLKLNVPHPPPSSSEPDEHFQLHHSQMIPDSVICQRYNNFNFPEKNLSVEERDLFFQQSLILGDCHVKHHRHLSALSKINVDNCDNIPSRKPFQPPMVLVSGSNSVENLEVVEEIDNEDNDDDDDDDEDEEEDEDDNDDDDDFDSDIDNCAATAAAIGMAAVTPTCNNGNNCCNKLNCKKKLNVNVCTESLQESPLSLACSGGHIEVVKLLISSGAKIEHRDKKSQTALHVAVLNGHLEVVRFLLDSGADMEAMVDRTKDTALSIACANGKLEIIEELVKKGANIEHRNISDYTPLSLAASGGYIDVIKFLLKGNAEINSRTNSKLGISPLMLAAMNGHFEAVSVLLDNGSDINAQIETNRNTALTLACFQGRTDVVSLLVDKKAYIEHRAKSGLTPLMEAASQGHVDVGRILIAAGADVNAPPVPASRETALIIASEKGHTDFVRLLLEHNGSVDARNKKGDTPLWLASNGGFIEVVKLLIDAMSDANSADNRRMTCLMTAFKKGHVKVVKELVKYVTQFPSEHDCSKHMKSIKNEDKDLIKRCEACKDIILKAKERQEYEAARNAKDLLKQVEEERKAKEQKEVKQAKKREKKKAKKKAKNEDKDAEVCTRDERNNEEEFELVVEERSIVDSVIELQPQQPQTHVLPQPALNNNNENINPVKSNKRSLPKQHSDKSKSRTIEEIKPVAVNIVTKPISSTSDSLNNGTRSTLALTNDSAKNSNNKSNSWIQISSTKVSSKTEDSNWQKIGGSKKKLDIQVNKKDIGKVIGQGGSVVNAIRHITAAHIDIDSLANELDERTVHLKGTLESVAKARDYICDLVDGNITGTTVIKESEPYLTKVLSSATHTTPSICLDFQQSKPLPIVKQNGKVNPKFGYTKSSTVTAIGGIINTNLQYGFSKAIKNPDFASVAAAGIVTSPREVVQQRPPVVTTKYPSEKQLNGTLDSVSTMDSMDSANVSLDHNEPLEVNTNLVLTPQSVPTSVSNQSNQSTINKSFPLAPGSERSLHQRTYNSTPEHSPQIESTNNSNSKNDMTTSSDSTITSNNSDKDGDQAVLDGISFAGTNQINNIATNNNINNNWPSSYHQQQYPVSLVEFEMAMNRFPKLQCLNPKAEAFSPSFVNNNNSNNGTSGTNNNLYNFKPEDFYYNVNGTLSLNPTAHIFKPRQMNYHPPQVLTNNSGPSSQEDRPIRLQDHINMAINILLRTNGFDHNMAEAAFSSFMRSANLDLNTRLSTSEFTSLINNIINQSNTSPNSNTSSHHSAPHNPLPLLSSSTFLSAAPQSTSSQSQSQIAQQWPNQSIWAPAPVTNGAPGPTVLVAGNNSPFFPNLSQCVSAQAAFNSPLSLIHHPSQLPLHPSQQSTNTKNHNSTSFNHFHHNPAQRFSDPSLQSTNGSPIPHPPPPCHSQSEV